MCGRFTLHTPFDQLAKSFKTEIPKDYLINYNIAPGQKTLIIPINQKEKMISSKWGLVPFWSKNHKTNFSLINSRAESVAQKPFYRKTYRCLIPADGFYEWDKKTDPKTAYYITIQKGIPFCFAGLYNEQTFSILTTWANSKIKPIHDRMPVILNHRAGDLWLDPKKSINDLAYLLKPFPSAETKIYQVSNLVNNPKNNNNSLIKQIKKNLI